MKEEKARAPRRFRGGAVLATGTTGPKALRLARVWGVRGAARGLVWPKRCERWGQGEEGEVGRPTSGRPLRSWRGPWTAIPGAGDAIRNFEQGSDKVHVLLQRSF